ALPDASSGTVTGDGPGADAVTLFLERAKQARLGFEPDDADLAAITELCRLVEGLPLAIEIAATWVRAMPCPDIAAAFRAGGADITSLTRNLPDRHRTLRATLEHSWSLLSQGERVALGRLAVFAGGFRAEAAAVVAGVGVDVLAALL